MEDKTLQMQHSPLAKYANLYAEKSSMLHESVCTCEEGLLVSELFKCR